MVFEIGKCYLTKESNFKAFYVGLYSDGSLVFRYHHPDGQTILMSYEYACITFEKEYIKRDRLVYIGISQNGTTLVQDHAFTKNDEPYFKCFVTVRLVEGVYGY